MEMKMINDEYRFNHDAQRSLLAFFVRRPREASSLIQPFYFTSPVHVDIARLAQEALEGKDLKADKLTATSLWALVSGYLQKAKRREATKHYKKEVQTLFEMELPDGKFWRDMAQKFSIEVSYRNALVEAERLVNAERYDAASRLFQELSAKPFAGENSFKLPIKCLHRFLEEATESDPVAEFVVYPIIPKCGGVLLYGLPKELKSWMGAALAVDVAAGSPKALGFFPVPRAARSLYVRIEDTTHMTAHRMKMLYEKQVGRSSKTIVNLKVISRCPLNLMDPKWLNSLELKLQKFKPEVIILDVFRRLFRGNVMDAKETAEFLQVLDTLRDKYGSAIVLVHHAKKGETPEIQSKALGSVNLAAWADVLIFLHGKRRVGNGTVSNIKLVSKAAIDEERQLVIRVDETKNPMVRVLDQERCDISVLRQCIRENPGLNQKEIMQKSGFGEKKLRPLLKRAIELGLLCEQHGKRKELRYFLPKPR
jgi:AAA domain